MPHENASHIQANTKRNDVQNLKKSPNIGNIGKITANALGVPLHTWGQSFLWYHSLSNDRYLGGPEKDLPKFSII